MLQRVVFVTSLLIMLCLSQDFGTTPPPLVDSCLQIQSSGECFLVPNWGCQWNGTHCVARPGNKYCYMVDNGDGLNSTQQGNLIQGLKDHIDRDLSTDDWVGIVSYSGNAARHKRSVRPRSIGASVNDRLDAIIFRSLAQSEPSGAISECLEMLDRVRDLTSPIVRSEHLVFVITRGLTRESSTCVINEVQNQQCDLCNDSNSDDIFTHEIKTAIVRAGTNTVERQQENLDCLTQINSPRGIIQQLTDANLNQLNPIIDLSSATQSFFRRRVLRRRRHRRRRLRRSTSRLHNFL